MNLEINRNKKYYRLWEIFPGVLTWTSFVVPIILSLYFPVFVACLVILYAVYWFFKSMRMSYYLIVGYKQYVREVKKDWLELCQQTLPVGNNNFYKIYHLVILAIYKEEYQTVHDSILAIYNSQYPANKIIFVLATEERDKDNASRIARKLNSKFKNCFFEFLVTIHPADIAGEVKGKGSNITYAAKQALKFVKSKNIVYENVIVTSLDADNRVHPKYFSCLTYKFLHADNPHRTSFQPIAMFFNNIWDVPLAIRSISVGSSFWQIIESMRPYRLRNFSAHAQSLAGLVKADFWSVKTAVEDGHQYWRNYLAFDGDHTVEPIFIPVYQDAVLSPKGYWDTFHEQYMQKRRWAWGCSDIPYVMTNIIPNKKLPFWDKWLQALRLIEGHFSWASTSIILAIIGWMPRLLNPDFGNTVLAYNFPVIYSRLLTTAMVGLIITLIISTLLLPPQPKKLFSLSVFIEWILSPIMLPISNIVFSSFPAVDAQTKLMAGKYLEFRVTRKKVATSFSK